MDNDFAIKRVRLASGLNLAYLEVSAGERAVVWIHGMGSYREIFHRVMENPPVAAWHLALDLPGFGDSDHLPRRQHLADYAEAVQGFLAALNLSEVVLVGHSFGGMVAGETVARFPDRIAGIILVSSAGWVDPINALTPTPFLWLNRIGIWVTGLEWFGRRMLIALGVDPDTVSRADRRRLQIGWRRAYEMARMGTFYHSPAFAERVLAADVPVSVIHGDRDGLFPLSSVRTVIDGRAPLWVIEGSGHVPFLSHPQAFSRAFAEAFDQVLPLHSDTR